MSKFPIFDTYPDYCSGIEYYHQKSKSEDHYRDTEGLSMGSCRKAERIRGSSTGRACVGCSPVSPAGCWQPEPGEALRGAGSQREGQRPLLIESLSLSLTKWFVVQWQWDSVSLGRAAPQGFCRTGD